MGMRPVGSRGSERGASEGRTGVAERGGSRLRPFRGLRKNGDTGYECAVIFPLSIRYLPTLAEPLVAILLIQATIKCLDNEGERLAPLSTS